MFKILIKPLYYLDYNYQLKLKNFFSRWISFFYSDLKINYLDYEIKLLKNDKSARDIFTTYLIHHQWKHEVYEQEIINKILYCYSGKKVMFIDVGASYGMFTYLASKFENITKIISIEAYKPVFNLLKNNILHNGIDRVIPLNRVVSSVADQNYLLKSFANSEWNRFVTTTTQDNSITSITLDEIIDTYFSDENMIFLKMDIEGNESKALKGLKKHFDGDFNINIMLEFHAGVLEENANGAMIFAKELFDLMNYSIYIIDVGQKKLINIKCLEDFSSIVEKLKVNDFPKNLFNLLLVHNKSLNTLNGVL